jgi:hypothetical protein
VQALNWFLAPAFLFVSCALDAQERRLDLGLRLGVAAADGEPANDMPGAGMLTHYSLNEDWTLGGAIDYTRFDFEEPAKLLGIAQDASIEAVDALAESTTVRVWIQRRLAGRRDATTLFVAAGLGAAFLDVPDVSGPTANGGRFDIETDAGNEILAFVLGGLHRPFGERWYGEAGLTLEQHFADWRMMDRASGARGTVDDYLSWGVYAAFGLRW